MRGARIAFWIALHAIVWLTSPGLAQADQWDPPDGAPVTWQQAGDPPWDVQVIHAFLLPKPGKGGHDPDGVEIGLIGSYVWLMEPGPVPPGRVVLFDDFMIPPYERDDDYLACSGHTLTADGSFFSAGGGRGEDLGLPYGMTFDPGLSGRPRQWERISQEMVGIGPEGRNLRWYPHAMRLADGRILVSGGFERWQPYAPGLWAPNHSVEAFTGSGWQLLSAHAESPVEIFNPDYTHAFQLPSALGGFDVLMFGEAGRPLLMSSDPGAPARWHATPLALRPGSQPGQNPNYGSSTAMLPIRLKDGEWGYANGSVLVSGGDHDTDHEFSVDVYDPVADRWLEPRLRMQLAGQDVRRHHSAAVLLPDSRVLVVAGHSDSGFGVQRAHYVDARGGAFTITPGTDDMGEDRGYHNVVVLLPDGRVLVGSGNPGGGAGSERPNFRYLHPPYLSAPARPAITAAPLTVGYGQDFVIGWSGKALAEAVLMSLGSMTHSIDMNQRSVQLRIVSQEEDTATLSGPVDGATAPPGFYMLFILDDALTPSMAKIVKLE